MRLIRLLLVALLLPATAMPARAAESLVIVEPDVELIVDAGGDAIVLPSAAASDALAARWPSAAAAALGLDGPVAAWRPPDDLRHDDPLAPVLALQEAVALALLEPDVRPRALSLGDGAAALATATGATHALFARVRAAPRGGGAVAMLVDLRSGAVLHHEAIHGLAAGADAGALADRLARALLSEWRGTPSRVVAPVPAAAAPPASPSDLAGASARVERRLRRHPRRLDDPALEATLHAVGCRIDAAACAAAAPIVLRAPDPYAAILPGGTLVIHTGMLRRLLDEAELAFVLAHELAHERSGDVGARLQEGRGGDRGAPARGREAAADRDAIAALVAAGYDPTAAVDLWTRLLAEAAPENDTPVPGSHPPTAERLAAARQLAAGHRGRDRGADRWEALVAPRRAAWDDDGDATGEFAPAVAAVAAGAGPDAPATGGRAPRAHTLRVLGVRFRTTLPWRQRPGIGAVAWTVDGTPLNRLVIVSGIDRGAPLLRDGGAGMPRWDGAAPGPATAATIAATLRRAGWAEVATGEARRHDFGGTPGVRAELALADDGGLRYRGTIAAAVRHGRLTWVAWVAPAEVYHPRDAAAVAAMLDGMRLR